MSAGCGGPAFPIPGLQADEDFNGMSLRDYFAAHCPITYEQAQDYNMSGEDGMAFYAAMRGEYADAMIAERAK